MNKIIIILLVSGFISCSSTSNIEIDEYGYQRHVKPLSDTRKMVNENNFWTLNKK